MKSLSLRKQIRALGRTFNPAQIQASQAIYADLLRQSNSGALPVQRDVAYGSHPRQRLDIHRPAGVNGEARPALVFVHGGGFIGGEKTRPNSPFYDNVGQWAASHGLVGINMTYRLAPQAPWPAGAEDVALALRWIEQNTASLNCKPGCVFLMGQSAGAVHVASYIAHRQFHGPRGHGLAGGIMLSGLYDLTRTEKNQMLTAYIGEDTSCYAARSSSAGLCRTDLPLLLTVSEFDPGDFQSQALWLATDFFSARGTLARILYLTDHNHISSVLQLGTECDTLGGELLSFVEGVSDGSIGA